jgi:hypothetical protein
VADRRVGLALTIFLGAVFLWTAPGRITFPDDEIVFQTTEALWLRGELAIAGIPKKTGEPPHLPAGSFGWALGRDGRRYGFFGHGLSVAALPMYGLARATLEAAPERWWHAVRSDHFFFHRRSKQADWPRLLVSLTNAWITALTAAALFWWLRALAIARGAALLTALAYGLGTAAWAYSRTFLSEPLSALCLVGCAAMIAAFHRDHRARWLWGAGLIAGLSAHVHALNLCMVPCLIGYALADRGARTGEARRAWIGAIALGGLGLLALGLGQWARFGSPLETGRFGHYSAFQAPWEGIAALLLAPGRSVFLYAPAVTIGIFGWAALRRRLPAVAIFVAAAALTRLAVISCRSDWYGGWGLGPRHLVPVLPLMITPLALVWERWRASGRGLRIALISGHAVAVALSGYLALFSIFEWMFTLGGSAALRASGLRVIEASHWHLWASPLVGFAQLRPDVLSGGAWTLARRGDPSLMAVFVAIAAIGAAALGVLVWALSRDARADARPRA